MVKKKWEGILKVVRRRFFKYFPLIKILKPNSSKHKIFIPVLTISNVVVSSKYFVRALI